jgi:serine/threonine protein kinase
MAAPSTADDLLTLLDKSQLLGSVDFDGYLRQRRHSKPLPASPAELAADLVGDGLLTRFQADNLLQGKWMRFFIGPYKVLDTLGAGTCGIVYLCEHDRMRHRVAIKVLQGAKARDPKSLERFYREARAAATLDHPNIVRAFDVGQEDRFHYLVMEFVDGQSLRQLVKSEGPLRVTHAADYLRQAALGLRHAHGAGLVHRDIKPSNVMIDREGIVKILDLGLARFFEDEGDVLTMGAVLGSADYIAPEQAADSHTVDIRADIYSLGATFWFAITGDRPPRGGSGAVRRPSQKLAEQRADIPEGMWVVLRRMMAPRPEDRYQTPTEVAEAIAPWAPDEVARLLLVETPPPQPAPRSSASQATIDTVPDQPAVQVPAPAPSTPALRAASKKVDGRQPSTARRGWVRRHPWLAAGLLSCLALAGGLLSTRSPGHGPVPGREPGSKPYFKPVSPHSP